MGIKVKKLKFGDKKTRRTESSKASLDEASEVIQPSRTAQASPIRLGGGRHHKFISMDLRPLAVPGRETHYTSNIDV